MPHQCDTKAPCTGKDESIEAESSHRLGGSQLESLVLETLMADEETGPNESGLSSPVAKDGVVAAQFAVMAKLLGSVDFCMGSAVLYCSTRSRQLSFPGKCSTEPEMVMLSGIVQE